MFCFLSFCLVLFYLFLVGGVSHASVFIYMYVSSYVIIVLRLLVLEFFCYLGDPSRSHCAALQLVYFLYY